MADWPTRLTHLDRFLSRFTRLRPGEGRSVVVFFAYALLLSPSVGEPAWPGTPAESS